MFGDKPIKSMKLREEDLKRLTDKFAASAAPLVLDAAPYLMFSSFDGDAIPKLAKVEGFCESGPMDLVGNFKSESGLATRVHVDVEAGADPAKQSLRVKFIIRKYPQEYTSDQVKELSRQLKERYKGIRDATFADAKLPTWKFDEHTRELWLMAPVGNQAQKRDRLRLFPGCSKALRLD